MKRKLISLLLVLVLVVPTFAFAITESEQEEAKNMASMMLDVKDKTEYAALKRAVKSRCGISDEEFERTYLTHMLTLTAMCYDEYDYGVGDMYFYKATQEDTKDIAYICYLVSPRSSGGSNVVSAIVAFDTMVLSFDILENTENLSVSTTCAAVETVLAKDYTYRKYTIPNSWANELNNSQELIDLVGAL